MDKINRIDDKSLDRWIHYEDDEQTAAQVLPHFANELKRAYSAIDTHKALDEVLESDSLLAVALERAEQIAVHGYDAAHDSHYTSGQLVKAATALMAFETGSDVPDALEFWPEDWDHMTFHRIVNKKTASERHAVVAALLLAEMDRIDRIAIKTRHDTED